MNGRCETDPLDKAVDVCDRCYGEYCDSHLLHPKGRKHPLCSECALVASGVRGSSKVVYRGERKTARKRRKQLLEAAGSGETQFFEFFDQEARSAEESAARAEKVDEPSDDLLGDSDDGNIPIPGFDEVIPTAPNSPDSDVKSVDETPPTPAVALLEQLRKEAETQSDPNRDTPSAPSTESMPASSVPSDDIPAELLERRKSFRTERSTLQPDAGHDGLVPLPNRQSTRPPVAPPPERASAAASVEPAKTIEPPSRELPPAEDRRRPTPPPTHRRATAPMIGEVRNVAGRRSDDTPTETGNTEPAANAAHGGDVESNEPDGTLNAVDVFDADHQRAAAPETRPDSTEPDSSRADVDSHGNWIPPVLRGIAPDAAEAKADLPQRPRR